MRGADHQPPGEYEAGSYLENYNWREVENGGGWPNDPRPLWARIGDVVARGVIGLVLGIAALSLLIYLVDANS